MILRGSILRAGGPCGSSGVLTVKPDGTQLFAAWYDRRNDTNNSWMDVYGAWGTIASNGAVSFGQDFRISTTNFPPVFAGTLTSNANIGFYDPVYPPGGVNLHWWYPEWLDDEGVITAPSYRDHVGEHNGLGSDSLNVYFSWTDTRTKTRATRAEIYQRDIRLMRLAWPQ